MKDNQSRESDRGESLNESKKPVGRRRRVDMAALEGAILRSPKYTSLNDFLSKTKAISRNTKTRFLRDKMLRGDCIKVMAEELNTTIELLTVSEPEEPQPYSAKMEAYRRYATAFAYGIHCDHFETAPDGSLQRQNVWFELEQAHGKRYPELSQSDKLNVLEKLCRDGFFFKAGHLDYRIKTHDQSQLNRIVRHFRFVAQFALQESLQFNKSCEAAQEFFCKSLKYSIEVARSYKSEGLNFRFARRRFFHSFGLELGQVAESIVGVLDAADQAHLQCRYLAKVKFGSGSEQYRNEIRVLNAPLLNDLEELYEILEKPDPNIDQAVNIVEQHPNNIARTLEKRDALLVDLKGSNALNYYEV